MPSNELATRSKELLPTVLLTLLSIVQALALELLWSHITETESLYHWSFANLLAWIQIAATLLGILIVWLSYSGMVMRFRWVPSTGDSVFPFIVGIVEFLLIASLGPDYLGQWFLTLAAIFAVMNWASHHSMRRARLDGDNDAFFANRKPATLRDHYSAIAIVAVFTLLGLLFWISGHRGWFALVAVFGALGVLAVQFWATDTFWRRSVQQNDLSP